MKIFSDTADIDAITRANDTVLLKKNYNFNTEILAASIKSRRDVILCMKAVVDIVTITDSVFFDMFRHPLTDQGLHDFNEDWNKVKSAGLT